MWLDEGMEDRSGEVRLRLERVMVTGGADPSWLYDCRVGLSLFAFPDLD